MKQIKRAGAAVAVAVAVTVSGVPSYADSICVPDEVGDTIRPIDMSGIRIDNAERAVRIRIAFRDLDRSRIGRVRVQLDTGKPMGDGYFIQFRRRASGGFSKYLVQAPMYGEYSGDGIACRGLGLTWGKNVAVIRLPRACMRHASDRVRGEVFIDNRGETRSDNVPDGALFTRWLPRG